MAPDHIKGMVWAQPAESPSGSRVAEVLTGKLHGAEQGLRAAQIWTLMCAGRESRTCC